MGRLLNQLLGTIVMAQLVLGTIPGAALIGMAHAQQSKCATGETWDAIMSRCMSGAQAAQVAATTASCSSAGDEAAQKKCYLQKAEAALADAEQKGEVKGEAGKQGGDMIGMVLSLGGLMAGAGFLMSGGGAGCGPLKTSAIIMSAASMAAFMGEVMAASTYKKKMKEADESLKKINEASSGTTKTGSTSTVVNATNVQEEAFKALIQKEDAVIAAAATKKKLYMLATVGYAAAMVVAGFELSVPMGVALSACKPIPASTFASGTGAIVYIDQYLENYFQKNQRVPFSTYVSQAPISSAETMGQLQAMIVETSLVQAGQSSLSAQDVELVQHLNQQIFDVEKEDLSLLKNLHRSAVSLMIPQAHAIPGLALLGVSAAVLVASKGAAKAVGGLYANATTRLVLGGVLTGYSLLSIMKAGKEAGKAKDRKAFLEKLRLQVVEAGTAGLNCTSSDASQVSAACSAAGVSVSTPEGASYDPTLAAANFGVDPTAVDAALGKPKCITNTGSYDAACSCKANNTCLSIGNKIGGSGIPAGVNLGSAISDLDAINGGKLASTQLDGNALSSSATRLNKLNDAIAAKNPGIKSALENAKKEADAFNSKLTSQIGSSGGLASAGGSGSSSSSDDLFNSKNATEALETVKEELKQEIGKIEAKDGAGGAAAGGVDLSGIEEGLAPGDSAAGEEGKDKLAEVMASEYEMGNNDINTETSSNIFDIVSNRYKRSGIRRLFGSEAVIPVDKPAATEVNR